MNETRKFDVNVAKLLGEYVYALRDPRDNKVFYVGKGYGNRIFQHFDEADSALKANGSWSAKLRRIVEIWEADENVDWFIIRRELSAQISAFDVEAAIIDAIEISQNGSLLNKIGGTGGNTRGILTADDCAALATPQVNPTKCHSIVFLFPINRAVTQNNTIYNSTRSWWAVSKILRSKTDAVAVGIANGLSQGVFSINGWTKAPTGYKYEFNGLPLVNNELDGRNWLTVIRSALGYWQRGNYLVVEFDGAGKFRFVRGSQDKATWNAL